jgi:PHD/YefM family antitoxin component YafN of YafNO toxin-antitoxin module
MPALSPAEAQAKFYYLSGQTSALHEPIVVTGKRGSVGLFPEDSWRSIQATMYLLNILEMRKSIRKGLATPIEDCTEEIDW